MKLISVLIVITVVVLISSHMEVEIDFPMGSSKKRGKSPLGIINKLIENIEEGQLNSKNNRKSHEIEIFEVAPIKNKKPSISFPSFLNAPFFNTKSKPNLVLGPIQGFEVNPLRYKKTSSISTPEVIEIETMFSNTPAMRKKHLRSPPIQKSNRRLNKQLDKIMMDDIYNEFDDMQDNLFDDIKIPHKKLRKHSHNPLPMSKTEVNFNKKAISLANPQNEVKNRKNTLATTLQTKSPEKQQTIAKIESPIVLEEKTSKFSKMKEIFNSTIREFSFAKQKHHIYIACYIVLTGFLVLFILFFALAKEKSNGHTEMKFMNDIVELK